MYKIIDRTPIYEGYKIDEEGYFILPKNKKGEICLYWQNCHPYGANTIGLIDGSKIRQEDWLELRKGFMLIFSKTEYKRFKCIGGSDTGVIFGYNDYKTVDQLSKEKRGVAEAEEIPTETEYKFHLGHLLEESAAIAFAEKEKSKACHKGKFIVFKDSSVFFNIRTGFMQANVDFFLEDGNGLHILECKTTANTSDWANGEIPMSYITQAGIHYPRCLEDLNIVSTYFVGLWNTNLNDVITRHFVRRKLLEETLEKTESVFNGFVLDGSDIPFGIFDESSKAVEKALTKKYPKATDSEPIACSEEINKICEEYVNLNKEKSALEKKGRELAKDLQPLKNKITEYLGEHAEGRAVIDGVDYKIDFSNKAARWSISAANLTALKEQEPDIYIELLEKGYITASEGRNFSIKEVKKPKEKSLGKAGKAQEVI